MNKLYFLGSILGILLCVQCSKQNKQTTTYPEVTPKTRIVVGNTGGFAGRSNHYEIMQDGSVFQYDMQNQAHTYLFDIPKKTAQQIFNSFEQLSAQLPIMDHTYNYQHEVFYFHDGKRARWIWEPSLQKDVPPLLSNTYYIINEQLKKNK